MAGDGAAYMASLETGETMSRESEFSERLARIEGAVEEIRDAIKAMASAIVDIAKLDMKHSETSNGLGRAFAELEKQDERISKIEVSLPVLKLTSGWVISGTIAVVALVGTAVIVMVIR